MSYWFDVSVKHEREDQYCWMEA